MAVDTVKNKIKSENSVKVLELLEFCIGDSRYGVDVAKVRELLQYRPVQSIPHARPWVEGVICPRNELLTVINLAAYLGHSLAGVSNQDLFIVTEFSKSFAAFHVHRVIGIHRLSEETIEKPDSAIFGGNEEIVTGVAKLSDRLISVLDFEKILEDVDLDAFDEINIPGMINL